MGAPFRPATRLSSPLRARRLAALRLIMDATVEAAATVIIMDAAVAAAAVPMPLPLPSWPAKGRAARCVAVNPSGTKRLAHALLTHTQWTCMHAWVTDEWSPDLVTTRVSSRSFKSSAQWKHQALTLG